ncbi:MAG: Lrp/AsnC family transcriptional regulator [Chryseobacterium jejuense]|uniref:Lrp/AsnC family transcriptional regulator n=1 Tax=Chryseobacterium jejuense TaxID=445960 RepID=UPI003D0A211B
MQLDKLHYAILNELQLNARSSNAKIGRKIGLTAPAVAERIRKLQEFGIIKGFSVVMDYPKLEYKQNVLIAVKLPPNMVSFFLKETETIEGIIKIIHTTGEYCFFLHVFLKSMEQLTIVLNRLGKFGDTTTFSILSIPIDYKPITF